MIIDDGLLQKSEMKQVLRDQKMDVVHEKPESSNANQDRDLNPYLYQAVDSQAVDSVETYETEKVQNQVIRRPSGTSHETDEIKVKSLP